jgi:hypothetical protein
MNITSTCPPGERVAVCIGGAARTFAEYHVHESIARHVLRAVIATDSSRDVVIFARLKLADAQSRGAAMGRPYAKSIDVPANAVWAALRSFERVPGVRLGTPFIDLLDRPPAPFNTSRCGPLPMRWSTGPCKWPTSLSAAHQQGLLSQLETRHFCEGAAASWVAGRGGHGHEHTARPKGFDWMIVMRPDLHFEVPMQPACSFPRSEITYARGPVEAPQDSFLMVPASRLGELGRGWRDWQACERLHDLAYTRSPESVLLSDDVFEAGHTRQVPQDLIGRPVISRPRRTTGSLYRVNDTSDAGESAHSQPPLPPHLNADVEPACTAYVPSSTLSRTRNP